MNDVAPIQDTLAPISRRAVAQILDSVLVALPALALAVAFGGIGGDGIQDGELLAITATQVGVGLLYETVAVAVWSMTVGKRVLGVQVVNSEDGGRVSWTYSGIRAGVPAVASLIPVIGPAAAMIVYLRAFFHPLRQGLHDAAAGTYVVNRRR